MAKKKTHEEFIKQVNEKFPKVEVFGKYCNGKTPIDFRCTIHDYIWQGSPRTLLLSKCGCPKCGIELRASKKKKNHEDFVEEMKSINKNIQILSKYSISKEYVKCKCKIDGYEWKTTANVLLSGKGCPKCGIEKVQAPRRRNQEKFIEQLNVINPDIKLVSSYKDSHEKIKVKCSVCDYEWSTMPGNLLYKKSKCPQCIGVIITPEYFRKKVYKLVGEEYSVITDYVDANTLITFKHNKCNTLFKMKPSSFFKSKTKCSNPECKHQIIVSENEKKFLEKIKDLNFELVDEYKGINNNATFRCLVCNTIFSLERASHIYDKTNNSIRCPSCSKNFNLLTSQKEYIHKFNKLFGKDFELKDDYSGADSPIKILHKKCGNISSYSKAGRLLTDYICPCKFCNTSNGEMIIINFLDNNSVSYDYQKRFEDLKGIGKGVLSYDFFLNDYNLLIEYQGGQHYKPIEHFGGVKQFDIQQEHDRRKRQYAKDHNIKLLEIWYWDFENIKEILSRELGFAS